MELKFNSIEEIEAFMSRLKKTRGGKADPADAPEGATTGQLAPPPLQPPQGGAGQGFPGGGQAGFAPPAGGATQVAGAFPVQGASVSPEVQALVTAIVNKFDSSVAAGTANVDLALPWFRSNCGPEAATATIDQIKTIFLPKLPVASLQNIAKLMGAA